MSFNVECLLFISMWYVDHVIVKLLRNPAKSRNLIVKHMIKYKAR